MSAARLMSLLSVALLASASAAVAAPKAAAPAPAAPPAPAPAAGSDAGSGSATAEPDEPPPKDMNGVDENPDKPKTVGQPDENAPPPPPMASRTAGYPIEEALRPITLPQNMSELSISPHFQSSTFAASDALRARYGITRQVQIGLTYAYAGVYHDPFVAGSKLGVHAGKAVGLDLTVLLQNWIGVRVGVPIYVDPVAVSLQIGVPIKFTFGDKLAIGGLDDLLSIRLHRFAPDFYQELDNAANSAADITNPTHSRGDLRFSFYGIYQLQSNVAVTARFGIDEQDFSANHNDQGFGGTTVFLRGQLDWSPRRWADLGVSLGFDDLAHGGTFGPSLYAAVRI